MQSCAAPFRKGVRLDGSEALREDEIGFVTGHGRGKLHSFSFSYGPRAGDFAAAKQRVERREKLTMRSLTPVGISTYVKIHVHEDFFIFIFYFFLLDESNRDPPERWLKLRRLCRSHCYAISYICDLVHGWLKATAPSHLSADFLL